MVEPVFYSHPLVLFDFYSFCIGCIVELGSFFDRNDRYLAREDHMQILNCVSHVDFFIGFDEDLVGSCFCAGDGKNSLGNFLLS